MDKNRIEGAAEQGEWARNREALVIKAKWRKSSGCAVKECGLTQAVAMSGDAALPSFASRQATVGSRRVPVIPRAIPEQFTLMSGVGSYSGTQSFSLNFGNVHKDAVAGGWSLIGDPKATFDEANKTPAPVSLGSHPSLRIEQSDCLCLT
jgi:hypothetical protein